MPEPAEADAAAGIKSKRQRLKEADDNKNVWPQQFPKLQGAERRDLAHLKAAGLKQSPTKNKDMFQHLGRALGGPDAVMRHKAVLQLEQYLLQRCESTGLSELDLLKLSKCLWYTLYMADRQVVQMELSKIIAKLVVEILAGTEEEDEYAAALYLRACEAAEEEVDSDEEDVDFMAKQMELLQEEEDGEEDEEEGVEELDDEDEEGAEDDDEIVEDDDEIVEDDDEIVEDDDDDNDDDEGDESEHGSCRDCEHNTENEVEDPVSAPHGRGAHLSALFFRTFLRTILQNWAQMDKYRIDKFYTMLRFIMERVFAYCASRGWNAGMIRLFNDGLCDEVLAKLPNGVRCHLIDVCLDELVKHEEDVTEAVFLDVVQPFFSMAQMGVEGDDLVHTRAVENVLERFLDKYSVFAERADDDESPRFNQVHVGTVAQFIFEMASDDMTLQRYRSRLYDVYKKYMKRIHQMGEENDVDISRVDLSLDEEGSDGEMVEDKDESNPVVEVLESDQHDDTSKPKNKKSEDVDGDAANENDKKKKKKRKKKKHDTARTSTDDNDCKEPAADENKSHITQNNWKSQIVSQIKNKVQDMGAEDEIVITIDEQRKAKAAMKNDKLDTASKKRHRDERQESPSTSGTKKVKFGDKNYAKSHKASMKALRQASPPAGIRPDRGILLNKDAKIPIKKPPQRKKSKGRR